MTPEEFAFKVRIAGNENSIVIFDDLIYYYNILTNGCVILKLIRENDTTILAETLNENTIWIFEKGYKSENIYIMPTISRRTEDILESWI